MRRATPFLSTIHYLLSILFLLPGGCNVIGSIANKTIPAPDIKAKYEPVPEPMVVVAENWKNPAGTALDAENLARFVHNDLLVHQVGPLIDPTSVFDLKSKRADFRTLSIAQIGKLVGARQVLYINMTECSLSSPGAGMARGTCSARIKIIDVESGQARWPEDSAQGYYVTTQTPMTAARDESDEVALKQRLQMEAGAKIASLFYVRPAE